MQNSSKTTTTPRETNTAIGMPLGGHGLAAPANTAPQDRLAALEMAVQQLQHSLQLPLVTEHDRNELEAKAAPLSVPARPEWIAARVASLLSPYYEKETPQAVREMDADDWVLTLIEYPRWAIDAAVRWWKGPQNDRRHRRPFEGDIAARAALEMGAVRAAKIKISAFDAGVRLSKPKEPEPSPISEADREHRAKVAAEVLGSFAARA